MTCPRSQKELKVELRALHLSINTSVEWNIYRLASCPVSGIVLDFGWGTQAMFPVFGWDEKMFTQETAGDQCNTECIPNWTAQWETGGQKMRRSTWAGWTRQGPLGSAGWRNNQDSGFPFLCLRVTGKHQTPQLHKLTLHIKLKGASPLGSGNLSWNPGSVTYQVSDLGTVTCCFWALVP